MSKGIELQIGNQVPNSLQNLLSDFATDAPLIDSPVEDFGNENGAVFFNLDWQSRQAEGIRLRLETLFGDSSAAPNSSENLFDSSWNNLVNHAKNHEDFAEFRHSPKNLWQQVRQMSEPRIVLDENGNQKAVKSRFDELLNQMQAKKQSLKEFVQTLLPNEREAFKARFQLEKTFGADIFAQESVVLDKTEQIRLLETLVVSNRPAELRESKLPISANPNINVREGELLFGAKNDALSETVNAAPQNYKTAVPTNTNLSNIVPNNAPQTASGNSAAVNLVVPETFNVRGLNNAVPDNKTNQTANGGRDAMAIGGALISGALAAIDNYDTLKNIRIGDGDSNSNIFGIGGGFAAGATGAMFGAAIGKVIPDAETVVSGVLGFISGVVVGIEADCGLRWLSAGEMNFNEITDSGEIVANEKLLTAENSLLSNSDFRLAAI